MNVVPTLDSNAHAQVMPPPASRRGRTSDVLFILALIAVQFFINDSWAYSVIGWLDSWYYVGYAFHYPDPSFFNDYYKASRLPWILTEFVVRSTVRGYLSIWLIHLLTLGLGSVGLYWLLLRCLDRSAALFGAALFATFTFSHAIGGADYHTEFSGALFALTWFLAVRAPLQAGNGVLALGLVGAAAALTVHTNVVFANFAPTVAAHWYLTTRQRQPGNPPVGRFLACTIAGALVATAVLGLVNAAVGRGFFFFMKQFNLALSFVSNPANQKPFWSPWSSGFF